MTRLLSGGKCFGPDVLERVDGSHLDDDERPHERLSDRECQVLRMIGGGRTVSEIADELELNVKTIGTYRARVLEKMHMRTNAELTRYAVEQNLPD
jgi:two-component system invasion response regulator UvrY